MCLHTIIQIICIITTYLYYIIQYCMLHNCEKLFSLEHLIYFNTLDLIHFIVFKKLKFNLKIII